MRQRGNTRADSSCSSFGSLLCAPLLSRVFVCVRLNMSTDTFSTVGFVIYGNVLDCWQTTVPPSALTRALFSGAPLIWTLARLLRVANVRRLRHLFGPGKSKSMFHLQGWTSLSCGSDCIILGDHRACRTRKKTVVCGSRHSCLDASCMRSGLSHDMNGGYIRAYPSYRQDSSTIRPSHVQILIYTTKLRICLCLRARLLMLCLSASRGHFVWISYYSGQNSTEQQAQAMTSGQTWNDD